MTPHRDRYTERELVEIAGAFELPGDIAAVSPFGSGHINETFAVQTTTGTRFVLQRLNTEVFTRPDLVMGNIDRVLKHQHAGIARERGDPRRECLTLVLSRNNRPLWVREADRTVWRCFVLIEDTASYDHIPAGRTGTRIAYQAALAFGRFQKQLAELPPNEIHETIPDFHNTPVRVRQLEDAVAVNHGNRLQRCRPEVERARRHYPLAPALVEMMERRELPKRVCHNDTKINNVLFDTRRSPPHALAVIDLDTVMPGTSLYDFGDLVRTATCSAAEDESDLSKIIFRTDLYEQLVEGWLAGVGDELTKAETGNLALGGKVITYTMAIRFLADYLRGDTYYPTACEDHNLVRARTQFRLLEEMERAVE